MKIFVTGAAGFIGSVVTETLIESGHDVWGFDSLKYGHRQAVHPSAHFVQGDLRNRALLGEIFASKQFDAVIHLGAEAYIDDSIRDPGLFFEVNTTGGLNLLQTMNEHGVKRIVFSSTAAIYGEPKSIPVFEDAPHEPVNSYGESKLQFERTLRWFHRAYGLNHVSLRYFNACGATVRYGEDRTKETHIIPILFEVVNGKRKEFSLFGNDYDTEDGTCVRDYVHVQDIANAHLLALASIDNLGERAYNLGSSKGYSNREVIEAVRTVTGHEIPVSESQRRPGDPATLVASHDRISSELGWQPKYKDLTEMIQTSWAWRSANPNGYSK
jgi:UDP-glucose 4-epimerase